MQTQPFTTSTFEINEASIVQCFINIHNPSSSPQVRKQADTSLIEFENHLVPLLKMLLTIFIDSNNNNYDPQIRLQALLYLGNVIKRNWNNKRLLKQGQELSQVKKIIASHLVKCIQEGNKMFMHSLFDIVKFIAKSDYPHTYHEFTEYCLYVLAGIQANEDNVKIFKELRDIFQELADRKGFNNQKSYEDGPRKILNSLGSITEALREELCKQQEISRVIAKLSKYCDQITICLLRMAPYCYLDEEKVYLTEGKFLSIYSAFVPKAANNIDSTEESKFTEEIDSLKREKIINKDIKSLVYQLGCLVVANPCLVAPVLSDFISVLFYIISKPELFAKSTTVKYALLSMRKVVKEFTYFSDDTIFQKSISSQPKSSNYLQLRKIAHSAYTEFMTEDTVQGLFNFILTTIMNIKSREDEGFIVGFDDDTGYEKTMEKDLTVHVCGTLFVEALIERFTEKILSNSYAMLSTCIENQWGNVDESTLINFLSILSILPKSCRKNQLTNLTQFPIISVLQFAHGSANIKIKEKFPALISGWLDIFTNEQIGQLIEALLGYVEDGAKNNSMQILLYSCYSLNRIVTLRSGAVDSGYILHKIFPISILVFSQTDNPEILWPLINLISSLLTKCEFDTSIIVSSVEANSLNSLISNESEMLVEALCEMFKSFLCIIPRNKPAVAVFKLIYHFLNNHLKKVQASYHEKCVILWYYSIREFSEVNQCNEEYHELFETHFKRCIFSMKPILIYILEEYLLLGLIENKLGDFVNIVLDFYKEGDCIENPEQSPQQNVQQQQYLKEEGLNLKISALSFQITLITKYNIEQVNSDQIMFCIMKDFCSSSANENANSNMKMVSSTLKNSLLSIVNRYVMLYPDYFFNFIQVKLDMNAPMFYLQYFRNMEHLTSRTAMKINALALISLLPKIKSHFSNNNQNQVFPCLATLLKFVIPEVEQNVKFLQGEQGHNVGKIENSPTLRFSQNILSERKEQIRKSGAYDEINIRQYFLQQLKDCLDGLGVDLNGAAKIVNENEQGDWGNRLLAVCI